MIWITTAVAFLATVIILLTIFYAFSPDRGSLAQRVVQLWRPPEARFREKQAERAQRVLHRVAQLLPGQNPQQLSRTQRLLLRAGYRRPETVNSLRGAKVILTIGFLSLVYFTEFYLYNPFFILLCAGLVGFMLPDFWLTRKIRLRQHRIRLGLPDALDLLVVCVEAGLGLDQALLRVSQELSIAHPELCEEIAVVNAEMRLGKTRLEALRDLASRTGVEDLQSLVAMLIQTERFGTSVAQSLRVHSDTLRTKRRQRAEEAAAKVAVKMVSVLVFLIFPALYVVILGPAVITLVRQLGGGGPGAG